MQNLYPLFEQNRILRKELFVVVTGLFFFTYSDGISGVWPGNHPGLSGTGAGE